MSVNGQSVVGVDVMVVVGKKEGRGEEDWLEEESHEMSETEPALSTL